VVEEAEIQLIGKFNLFFDMLDFHPWGELGWIVNKFSDVSSWDLVGCISSEDRSTAALQDLKRLGRLHRQKYVEIIDPESEHTTLIKQKVEVIRTEYRDLVGPPQYHVIQENLLAASDRIVRLVNDFFASCSGSLVLDVSTFPKRFFYPFIKLAFNSVNIQNLLIVYSTPNDYPKQELSDDPEPWDHLPLFGPVSFPDATPKHAIVGVGFIPFSLSKLLKDKYSSIPITFLFPFPPGPPLYQRSWEFLRIIEKTYNLKPDDRIIRVNSIDVSDTFNHIKSITNNGADSVIFAPYGPKPISIAMAIYSVLSESPVYYTQPKKYHPDYSIGRGKIYAFAIKKDGEALYCI
jgi:hypothetical protein